jgi:hypothetical protein
VEAEAFKRLGRRCARSPLRESPGHLGERPRRFASPSSPKLAICAASKQHLNSWRTTVLCHCAILSSAGSAHSAETHQPTRAAHRPSGWPGHTEGATIVAWRQEGAAGSAGRTESTSEAQDFVRAMASSSA